MVIEVLMDCPLQAEKGKQHAVPKIPAYLALTFKAFCNQRFQTGLQDIKVRLCNVLLSQASAPREDFFSRFHDSSRQLHVLHLCCCCSVCMCVWDRVVWFCVSVFLCGCVCVWVSEWVCWLFASLYVCVLARVSTVHICVCVCVHACVCFCE